jgi:hypothetical protein
MELVGRVSTSEIVVYADASGREGHLDDNQDIIESLFGCRWVT